jgi:hypothetical protein
VKKNILSPAIWTKAYSRNVMLKAYNAMDVFSVSGPEDIYMSIVFAYFADSFYNLKFALVNYSVGTGMGGRKLDNIDTVLRWLRSYSTVVSKTRIFVDKYMPDLKTKCDDLEYYSLNDFVNTRLFRFMNSDVLANINNRKVIFNLLPEYFSNDSLSLLFYDFLKQSNINNKYLNFNTSLVKNTKKLCKIILLYLHSFLRKDRGY